MFFASLWVLTITICGFSIFSRNHHNCIKIITIVCSFIIMTSSCLYLPYLGGQAFTKVNDPIVGQPKKPIQPTHESPLNHAETQNCQSCGHAPVFFFVFWVVAWQMAFIFVFSNWQQLRHTCDPQAAARKCHQRHQPQQPREAWGFFHKKSWIDRQSKSEFKVVFGCHKYDVIRPEVMEEHFAGNYFLWIYRVFFHSPSFKFLIFSPC